VIGVLLGPVHFTSEKTTTGYAWTGPSSLLGASDGASLLDVYGTDSD
jgi:hypothetical protein